MFDQSSDSNKQVPDKIHLLGSESSLYIFKLALKIYVPTNFQNLSQNLSPKFRRNLLQVIPFGIIWLILGWVFLWVEYAMIITLGEPAVPQTGIVINSHIVC